MKDFKYQDEIELYLSGKGNKQAFERQLGQNSELRAEYEARLAEEHAAELLAHEHLNEELNNIREDRSRRVMGMPPKILKYAAIVLFSLGIGTLWYANLQVGNTTLVESNYVEPDFRNVRSESKPERFDMALEAYFLQDFNKAIRSIESITEADRTYVAAQYLLGHTYFNSGNYLEAAKTFDEVSSERASELNQSAQWHLVLSYLKNDNLEKANQVLDLILKDSDHPYSEKALKLKAKLQSIWRNFIF